MRPIVFGIDISDRSIEIISLFQRKGQLGVALAGRREIPAGIIDRGVIQDADALVKTLTGFFDAVFGPKRGKLVAAAALPANIVFSRAFTMPATLERDLLRKAVAIEAADVFPIPMQDIVDDLVVSSSDSGGPQDILYAVASRESARAYRNVLVRAGARVQFLDSEDLALARGLGAAKPAEPLLIVDIGNRTTAIMLVDRNGLRMSSSIPFGGSQLVGALETKLKLTFPEAEKLMRAHGFDPGAGDGRSLLVLQKPTEELVIEIRKTLTYAERRFSAKVRGIILAGGISLIPGMVEYLASNFQGLAVGRGEPFRGVWSENEETTDRRKAVLYATALGLAARAVGARASPGMNLLPDAERSNKGPLAAARRLFQAITSSLSMVTHGKKSHPKKKHADAEEPTAKNAEASPPEPVEPSTEGGSVSGEGSDALVEGESDAAETKSPVEQVEDLTPPELKEETVAVPEEAAATEGEAVAETPAEPEQADEPDFGLGIGDILRGEEEIKTQKVDLSAPVSSEADAGKLSIEDILNRDTEPAKPQKAAAKPLKRPAFKPRSGERSGAGKVIAMVILVLICFGIAATGIYAFVKKNGLPKLPSLSSMKKPAVKPDEALVPSAAAPSSVSLTFMIGTSQKPSGEKTLLVSRIIETDVKASDSFDSTGTAATSADRATGSATIVNTTSKSYTFVATTRLLSKDGVLFRMKSASPIPANGSVEVVVAADQPGPEGDIGPSTFTIPGLPPDLQKVITAKSDKPMSGGSGTVKAVAGVDIVAAKNQLTERLKKEALDNFGAMLADGEKLHDDLVTSKEIAASWPKSGTLGSTFNASVTLRFRALLVPVKDLAPLLAKNLAEAMPQGMNAADFSLGDPLYTVQAYDEAAETAEVRVEVPVIKR